MEPILKDVKSTVYIDPVTYKAVKRYADLKGMDVNQAVEYLLGRDMLIFYDGIDEAYKSMSAKLKESSPDMEKASTGSHK